MLLLLPSPPPAARWSSHCKPLALFFLCIQALLHLPPKQSFSLHRDTSLQRITASSSFSWCDHHQQLHLFFPCNRQTSTSQASQHHRPFVTLPAAVQLTGRVSTTIDSTRGAEIQAVKDDFFPSSPPDSSLLP